MNEVAEAAAVGDVGRAVCEESVTKARALKDMGNEAYRNGRHAEAVELFRCDKNFDVYRVCAC